jgi:hypothetical protein
VFDDLRILVAVTRCRSGAAMSPRLIPPRFTDPAILA